MTTEVISFKLNGDFSKTAKYLERLRETVGKGDLNKYGKRGVEALALATPKDTGKTAASWSYEITHDRYGSTISFLNSNIQNGVPIAIVLQYGHGTKNGGYVQGRNYIDPAIQPIFDEIVNDAWKEVKGL